MKFNNLINYLEDAKKRLYISLEVYRNPQTLYWIETRVANRLKEKFCWIFSLAPYLNCQLITLQTCAPKMVTLMETQVSLAFIFIIYNKMAN